MSASPHPTEDNTLGSVPISKDVCACVPVCMCVCVGAHFLELQLCLKSKKKRWPYIINIMWLLIQSCSICVSQDYVFYIPFYLVTEATAHSPVSLPLARPHLPHSFSPAAAVFKNKIPLVTSPDIF